MEPFPKLVFFGRTPVVKAKVKTAIKFSEQIRYSMRGILLCGNCFYQGVEASLVFVIGVSSFYVEGFLLGGLA